MEISRSSAIEGPALPSNRSFGLMFCVVFAIVAIWPILGGGDLRLWSLLVSGLFAAVTLFAPDALTPLNRAWMRFGALLHRIVSPIVLAVLFFLVITPFALMMRAGARDPLRLRRNASATYWVERKPPGPTPESLNRQF